MKERTKLKERKNQKSRVKSRSFKKGQRQVKEGSTTKSRRVRVNKRKAHKITDSHPPDPSHIPAIS